MYESIYNNPYETIYAPIIQGVSVAIAPIVPYLWVLIIGLITVSIAKSLIFHFVYDMSLFQGYTKRESRRRARKAENFVELVSTINDLQDSLKTNK